MSTVIYLTELTEIVRKNNIELVRNYLTSHPNINFKDYNCIFKPLYTALTNKYFPIAELLLEHGADIDETSGRTGIIITGLVHGIMNKDIELIKFCIGHGADINVGTSVLIDACANCFDNNFEIIKFLLASGANVNLINYENQTALDVTIIKTQNIELAYFLLSNGAILPSNEFINSLVYEHGRRCTEIQKFLKFYKLSETLYIFDCIGISLNPDNIDMLQDFLHDKLDNNDKPTKSEIFWQNFHNLQPLQPLQALQALQALQPL